MGGDAVKYMKEYLGIEDSPKEIVQKISQRRSR